MVKVTCSGVRSVLASAEDSGCPLLEQTRVFCWGNTPFYLVLPSDAGPPGCWGGGGLEGGQKPASDIPRIERQTAVGPTRTITRPCVPLCCRTEVQCHDRQDLGGKDEAESCGQAGE